MSLAGKGVLAIWNGIDESAEADFLAWHVGEHIPERVSVPGFLRGRRYASTESWPKYFNFYETETWETLIAPAYLERLNSPSPWTKRVVSHFRDTCRTLCTVAISEGQGDGAWIAALRLGARSESAPFAVSMHREVILPLLRQAGIIGAHLLEGKKSPSDGPTAEKALRGQPDAIAEWILLVEAAEENLLRLAINTLLASGHFDNAGAILAVSRDIGFYRLQYGLARNQLAHAIEKS